MKNVYKLKARNIYGRLREVAVNAKNDSLEWVNTTDIIARTHKELLFYDQEECEKFFRINEKLIVDHKLIDRDTVRIVDKFGSEKQCKLS